MNGTSLRYLDCLCSQGITIVEVLLEIQVCLHAMNHRDDLPRDTSTGRHVFVTGLIGLDIFYDLGHSGFFPGFDFAGLKEVCVFFAELGIEHWFCHDGLS